MITETTPTETLTPSPEVALTPERGAPILPAETLSFSTSLADLDTYDTESWGALSPAEQLDALTHQPIFRFAGLSPSALTPEAAAAFRARLSQDAPFIIAAFHARRYEQHADTNPDTLFDLTRTLVHQVDLSALSDEDFGLLCDDRLATSLPFMQELRTRILSGSSLVDTLQEENRFGHLHPDTDEKFPALATHLRGIATTWRNNIDAVTSTLPEKYQTDPALARHLHTLDQLHQKHRLSAESFALLDQIITETHDSLADFDYRLFDGEILAALGPDFIMDIAYHRELSDQLIFLHEHAPAVFTTFTESVTMLREDVSLGDFRTHCELVLRFLFQNQDQLTALPPSELPTTSLLDFIIYHSTHPEHSVDFTPDFTAQLAREHDTQIVTLIEQIQSHLDRLGLPSDHLDQLPPELYSLVEQVRRLFCEAFLGCSLEHAQNFLDQYTYVTELSDDDPHVARALSDTDITDLETIKIVIDFLDSSRRDLTGLQNLHLILESGLQHPPRFMLHTEKNLYNYCLETYRAGMESSRDVLQAATTRQVTHERLGVPYTLDVIDMTQNPDLAQKFSAFVHNNHTGWGDNAKDFAHTSYVTDWADADPYAYHLLSCSYLDTRKFSHVDVDRPGAVLYGFLDGQIMMMSPQDVFSDGHTYAGSTDNLHRSSILPATLLSQQTKFDVYNEVVLERRGLVPDCLISFTSEESVDPNAVYDAAADWAAAGHPIPIVRIDRLAIQDQRLQGRYGENIYSRRPGGPTDT